ncbi:magnesium chelatase [Duganella sp. Leaf126]|uniref:magnesium chelatase subunit D family protein n=1 Tax=Duganella sp. Leaf126 TaxID=1736266 RepID=UPI0006FDC02C|nr:magnesium chelatase subunit D family protein [Duganella sp. Leaf126]KQQ45109.1 magnesium chelatase [Duganella sp. Leaf126]
MNFPFTAIVGQEQLRLALMLCAVDPGIGGVLIRGDKGTAKSTAARALAEVLPPVELVAACAFNCAVQAPCAHCETCNQADRVVRLSPVPFVTLPLGATEDRVLGSLDLSRALSGGQQAFQPGLLAAAHRGLLYIDEVNLLADHLVDVLLDVAAMGVNRVQREGLAVSHPARFTLVGTMNQEEGDLRPQLLDRFGLMVEVTAPRDKAVRAEVVRRRIGFEADPASFSQAWREPQEDLQATLARAQQLLPQVTLDDALLDLISHLCCELEVASLRADIVMYKTARAIAALDGRLAVTPNDIRGAAELVLPHRRRRKPFEQPGLDQQKLDELMQQAPSERDRSAEQQAGSGQSSGNAQRPEGELPPESGVQPKHAQQPDGNREPGSDRAASSGQGQAVDHTESGDRQRDSGGLPAAEAQQAGGPRQTGDGGQARDQHRDQNREPDREPDREQSAGGEHPQVFAAAASLPTARISVEAQSSSSAAGRRSVAQHASRGQVLRAVPNQQPDSIAIGATLRSAALRGVGRGGEGGNEGGNHGDNKGDNKGSNEGSNFGRLQVTRADLHQQVRVGASANLILFVVDASGSMAAQRRMEALKGAVLSLLTDAYQQRDEVAVVAFRGQRAELLLAPTRSVDLAEQGLRSLPTGGRTPLPHALQLALETLQRAGANARTAPPLLVLLTDGKGNVPMAEGGDAWGEALAMAELLAERRVPALVIDTESGYLRLGRAAQLAQALGAECLTLEELSADSLALTVRARLA